MKPEEIISSGLLECYVLGLTNPEETDMISTLCKKHPELLTEIEIIERALIMHAQENVTLTDSTLKNKISAQIHFNSSENKVFKVISLNTNDAAKFRTYQFVAAAALLLFFTSFVYVFLQNQNQTQLKNELLQSNKITAQLQQELNSQKEILQETKRRLQIITQPGIKSITMNGMNGFTGTAALVYWNPKTEELYFNCSELPANSSEKQYQLWAIVDGKAMDAGVIDNLSDHSVFQKMKAIKAASAFAITIEKKGGSITPTLETICLMGNV